MSKSAGGLGGACKCAVCGFDIDFLIANDLARDGDIFALIFDGDRGISGDTAFDEGAILVFTMAKVHGEWLWFP
jgi:hypothetical protein